MLTVTQKNIMSFETSRAHWKLQCLMVIFTYHFKLMFWNIGYFSYWADILYLLSWLMYSLLELQPMY